MNIFLFVLILIFVPLVIIGGLLFGSEPSALEEKIGELRSNEYSVDNFFMSFAEFKAEKIAEGDVFHQIADWSTFLQEIQNVKDDLGFVTVWACETEHVFWVHATEQTYYYYSLQQAD